MSNVDNGKTMYLSGQGNIIWETTVPSFKFSCKPKTSKKKKILKTFLKQQQNETKMSF